MDWQTTTAATGFRATGGRRAYNARRKTLAKQRRAKLAYLLAGSPTMPQAQAAHVLKVSVATVSRDIAMVMGPVKTIQHMLGIDSPSKETYWMGEMMGDGFVFALEDAHDRVAAAMTYMMQGALDAGVMMSQAIQNAVGGGGDMGELVGAAVAGATGGRDSGDLDARGGYSGPSSFVMNVDGKVLGQTAIHYGAEPVRASKRRTYGGGGAGGGTRR